MTTTLLLVPRILISSDGPALYNPAELSEVELDYSALK